MMMEAAGIDARNVPAELEREDARTVHATIFAPCTG